MKPIGVIAGAVAGACIAVLGAGCGTGPAVQPAAPRLLRGAVTAEPVVSAVPYAAADLRFGLALLHEWCAQDPTANIVLSPASLASGLGMAYLGARGATAQAMATALGLPPASAGLREAGLRARALALRGLDGPGVTVAASNQVWADPRLLPLRGYLDAVATGYDAGVGRAPLLTQPAKAAAQINAAVSAATDGHIRQLLTPGQVGNADFVLTDAEYLSARWANPFQRAEISAGGFLTAAGQQATARYLNGAGYAAATAAGWTAVALPYEGGRLAMTALLPPAGASQAGCPALTASAVASLEQSLARQPADVSVSLPEVSLRSSEVMNGLLAGLGMGVAFTPAANFTGLSPAAGYLGTVVHAATLRVDAAGTVASAATGVTVLPGAEPVLRTVAFNRPYLLLISAAGTGEPLFLARVADPDLP
ncbi:MAG TPA: serpin family protein [Streptosporangiaceae bacterium]|nr:serpin family protein [Streptosporangiaceae bacterium]